jgi:hypothetical protein
MAMVGNVKMEEMPLFVLLVVSDEVEVQIIYTVLYTPSKSVVQILR